MEIGQVIKRAILVVIITACVIGTIEYANSNMKRQQITNKTEESIERQ